MRERIIGQVRRVNGPVIEAKGVTDAMMLETIDGRVMVVLTPALAEKIALNKEQDLSERNNFV